MSAGIETVEIVEPWLYSTLSGDAELSGMVNGRIVGSLWSDELASPYVTFSLASEVDVVGASGHRIMADAIYTVKAVAQTTSQSKVAPIAKRIDALLTGCVVSVAGGWLLSVRRTSVVSYPEVSAGQPFLHLGGSYRFQAHSG